jgi:hypothetical protein
MDWPIPPVTRGFAMRASENLSGPLSAEFPSGRLTAWAFTIRLLPILSLGVAAVILLCLLPALPQPLAYHDFADQRTLLGVPHLLNVISNVPFVVIGVLGLCFLVRKDVVRPDGPFRTPAERWPFVLLFLSVLLTGFGSAWYHLHPDNDRLVWDRLPMSVAFMSLFAAVLAERLDVKLGTRLLVPLVLLGIGTVLYWYETERQGQGDLRPYYFVQFYPVLALPLLLLLFPPSYTRTVDLLVALGWYVVAKFCEHPGDAPLYRVLGHTLSGHTLKHLAAAAGAFWLLLMLRRRHPIRARIACPT